MDESLDPIGIDDYDFPWRMAEAGVRFMAISDCLYLWRDHRESFRLTTHVPRNAQVRTLRRIMRKHGVRRARVELQIAAHRRSQLRQCLYRSPLDRWLKARLGHDPRRGWREPYC
jgi:GT2 family glycosyltransferase